MAHIGIDARLPHYRVGGISTYIRQLINALEKIDRNNHYTVFQSRRSRDSLASQFQRADLWTPPHHRFERQALSIELWRYNLTILHSPDFIPPLRGARYHIITVHDLTFMHYPQYLTSESRSYYNNQIMRAVRQADHILTDSESTKRDLIEFLNVPSEKITVHMLGVDEKFRPLSPETLQTCRRALRLPPEYFLFVGTIEPRKNIAGLLRAYQQFFEKTPDAPPLVLVGKPGWLSDDTLEKIKKMERAKRIIWRQDITDENMPVVYNLAIALITPSFYEGFGLPALEAMACGTMPIVSNRSSLPEIIGDAGLLIEPDQIDTITEALEKVIIDDQWRKEMKCLATRRAASFTWENTARIVLNTYQSVL